MDASTNSEDDLDGSKVKTDVEDSDEEEEPPKDPKTDRELQTLARISVSSGAAKVILQELQKTRTEAVKLDPISSSRTPSANYEPPFSTRYENPVFACELLSATVPFLVHMI